MGHVPSVMSGVYCEHDMSSMACLSRDTVVVCSVVVVLRLSDSWFIPMSLMTTLCSSSLQIASHTALCWSE